MSLSGAAARAVPPTALLILQVAPLAIAALLCAGGHPAPATVDKTAAGPAEALAVCCRRTRSPPR
ncbi:hypothetical protein [Amycolatopsis benzoatilytica]|uniref:hypothetical protein n=1 Tax=Amycolatopsis benzoatilytica TaxID=346045 RepID=UPI0003A6D774|nr:hypothetical protein [Amycolatopsis benzoatilytica]